jgi:hypothetical protein
VNSAIGLIVLRAAIGLLGASFGTCVTDRGSEAALTEGRGRVLHGRGEAVQAGCMGLARLLWRLCVWCSFIPFVSP